ncbi:AhpC/TSA family protein [Marinilabiliaceae bacterium JC017]|nr:AhpC/TSA family protein [Marinilabiliaceae bacterium JC017]
MRNFLFALTVVLFAASCSTKEEYKVYGKIENGEGKMLYFERLDMSNTVALDSLKLKKDGKFTFSGDRLDEPTFFLLKLSDNNFITLLADTVEKVEVAADAVNFTSSCRIQNSIGSAFIQILNKRHIVLRDTVDALVGEYTKLGKKDAVRKQQIADELTTTINEHKKLVGEFVMDNPRSFASYYALFQRFSDNTLIMNVMDKNDQVFFSTIATSLNVLYPESERVKHLYNYVLEAKVRQQRDKFNEMLMSQAEESGFPDIEEETVDGKKVKLSSLKGKVVILSFWASWDDNSRKHNAQLKKLYKKYKGKDFEIYQVSLDRSKVLWESAIEKDNLPWINVSDLRYTDSYPARVFNVKQLPANFIISRKGDIVGKDLFGSRLDEKIKELY